MRAAERALSIVRLEYPDITSLFDAK